MIQNFDVFNLPEIPELTLCNPDGTELYSLKSAYNVKINLRFNAVSDMEFDFPYDVGDGEIEAYAYVISKRLVHVENFGYFQIVSPTKNENGISSIKHVKANSIDYELIHKKVTAFGGTYKLYDILSPDDTVLGKMVALAPSWTVAYVDSSLLEKYRNFSVTDTNVLRFLIDDVEKAFGCVVKFNYEDKSISVYDVENATSETDIFLSFDNLVKELNLSEISDEICTALLVYGSGDLDIRTVNPLGTNYIYDFSYFKTTDWMSQSLIDSLTTWENLVSANQTAYADTLSDLKTENQNLIVLSSELANLQAEYNALVGVQAVRIENDLSYSDITTQLTAKQAEIDSKQGEIDSSNSLIDSYETTLSDINSLLSFSSNFTEDEIKELSSFVFENTYQNENIIQTDSMTPDEVQEQAQQLYDQGINVLSRLSQPRYEFDMTIVNFIQLQEFSSFTGETEVGAEVTIELSDSSLVTAVLLEVSFSFENPNDFSATFSNRLRLDKGIFAFSDLQGKTVKAGSAVSFDSLKWANWENNYKNDVSNFINSSLNAASNNIISDDNQEIIINENGLRARRYSDILGGYEDSQMWLTSKSLAFTTDNWQTASLAIGRIYYNDAYVYGVVGGAIVGNIIAGNTLRIENDANNFVLDENGAVLNNADFTINSTDGKSRIYLNANEGIRISTNVGGTFTDKFYVDTSGNVVFKGDLSGATGTFSGSISATEGFIGTMVIDEFGLKTADGVNYMRGDGTLKWGGLSITPTSAVFTGTIYADKLVGQIDTPQLATNAVTNEVLASGINAGKITVGDMSGSRIYGGTITGPGISIALGSTGVPTITGNTAVVLQGSSANIEVRNYAYIYGASGGIYLDGTTRILGALIINGKAGSSPILYIGGAYAAKILYFTNGILTGWGYA